MHPTSVMGRADANQLVNYWAHLLNHTWTQATGITFTGWQACTTPNGPNYGQDDVINVHILDMDCAASTSMQGSESDGTSEILVMPCRNVVYDDMVMIHEFGHALGFDHEADRKDFPTITSKNCPWMGITKGTSTASNEYTLPDPFSMMNATYCHALIELSYEDIVGAQNAWGRPNYFADVTGDGADDAIVVNPDGAYVIANAGKRNSGGGHFTGSASNWGGFAGKLGTFFADVNGDRKADMIAVDTKGVAVSLSNGSSFAAYKYWTSSQFVGLRGTYFADIDGDGKADAIRATTTDFSGPTLGFEVRKSTGTSFGNPYNPNISLPEPMVGSRGWFADVTGPDSDGKSRADFIYYNTGGVWVNKNGPSGFKGGSLWLAQTGTWAGTNQVPALPVLFADING
jgi:hypothetical protein